MNKPYDQFTGQAPVSNNTNSSNTVNQDVWLAVLRLSPFVIHLLNMSVLMRLRESLESMSPFRIC